MMDHLVWELVAAHADTPTLLRVRRLCRDAAQLAELVDEFPAAFGEAGLLERCGGSIA